MSVLLVAGGAIVLASDPCGGEPEEEPVSAGGAGEPEPPEAPPEVIEVDPGEEDLGTAWQRAFFEAMAAAIADGGLAAPPEPPALAVAAPSPPPVPVRGPAAPGLEEEPGRPLLAARPRKGSGDAAPRGATAGGPRPEPETPPPPEPPAGASFDKDSVKAAVSAIKPGVRECYKQGLRQDPYLAGEVYIRFTVRRDGDEGRITDAEFLEDQTTMADVIVQACILEALSRARFPPPEGETQRVTYPFQFRKIPRKQPQAPGAAPTPRARRLVSNEARRERHEARGEAPPWRPEHARRA